jgi:hypothetical protein
MERKITNWRKASASANGEACLEAGTCRDGVAVRDSQQGGQGPVLSISPAAWSRFVGSLR